MASKSMYLVDAAITPALMGASPGSIQYLTPGGKGHSKSRRPRDDNHQLPPFPSPQALVRPLTISSLPQSMASSSLPPPHRRSRSITPPRASGRDNRKKGSGSMPIVSFFFKNSQPLNTDATPSITGDKPLKLFGRSEPKSRSRSPSPTPRRKRLHRYSHSMSGSLNIDLKQDGHDEREALHPLSFFTPTFPALFSITPSPEVLKRFHPSSRRQNKANTKGSGAKSQNSSKSTFREGDNDDKRGRNSPLPVIDITDADAFYHEDDACSCVSSIQFADDPDDKPPNRSGNRDSAVTVISNDSIIPSSRLNRESFVLDISAENRIGEDSDRMTEEQQGEGIDAIHMRRQSHMTKSQDRLLRTLGELPRIQQTDRRRHSVVPESSPPSQRTSMVPPSTEPISGWHLPDIPIISPIDLPSTALVPKSTAPASPSSKREFFKKRRSSSLLWSSMDEIATMLKKATNGAGGSRPFEPAGIPSSLFSPPSSPFVLSLFPESQAAAKSDPYIPPGLSAVAHDRHSSGEKWELDGESGKDKTKGCRTSVSSEDSISDLHHLPSSLTRILDDSQSERQSVVFDTAPSTPILSSLSAPPSSESHTESSLSVGSTTPLLRSDSPSPRSDSPSPDRSSTDSTPVAPFLRPMTLLPLGPPSPVLPPPNPSITPLSLHLPSTSADGADAVSPITSGAELVIDPTDSTTDPLVSPIIFAFADHDGEYDDDEDDDRDSGSHGYGEVDQGGVDGHGEKAQSEEGGDAGSVKKKVLCEEERKRRLADLGTWGSVRVPLRKKNPDRDGRLSPTSPHDAAPEEGIRSAAELNPGSVVAVPSKDRRTWIGEWNIDMQDVIRQLRSL